ncbi:eukaryotic rRNA processing [Pisolithus thermaeus]|nr:eukaryotic rRNA processing [Pisolithus croceorrhizus]KAI6137608.1 eukaryotic rRNA processing [Pisolithus thermaeus]
MPKFPPKRANVDESSSEEDEFSELSGDEQEDVALDDVEDGVVGDDIIPKQKVEIDNTDALRRIRETIQLDPSLPWTETLVVTYPETIEVDINDDLSRELAFYKQALHSAERARTLAAKHSLPFTRPSDYFAEMVKSDAHMERIRMNLLGERAGIKKAEEKKKEREAKKFGKQVQIEKQKERERSKKEMTERLKTLKRKRRGALENAEADGEEFDVAVEEAIGDERSSKRPRKESGKKMSRSTRDAKYGFGGKGRRSKQNTRTSTDSFVSGSSKKDKGKGTVSKRPGKSRRQAMKNQRS